MSFGATNKSNKSIRSFHSSLSIDWGLPVGQIILCKSEASQICPALSRKIFRFRFSENHAHDARIPPRLQRGERVVTIVGRDAMDANAPA
jgi:hypothetical protein